MFPCQTSETFTVFSIQNMEDASKKNLAETSYLGTYYNCRKIRVEETFWPFTQETNFLYLHFFYQGCIDTHKHGNFLCETSM